MSEHQGQQHEDQQPPSQGAHVDGVDLDPDDKNKSIAVDTHERLEHKGEEPTFDEIPEDELEKERQERLSPENRPENVEIDNSDRDFDPETGLFEDSEVDELPEGAPFATTDAEQQDTSEPKDRTESPDPEQSKEATESRDTEG